MKKSRLLGILGAFVLTFGVMGVASAETLKDAHVGITVGWDDNGDPYAVDANEDEFPVNPEECADLDLAAGDIVLHFVQSGQLTVANGSDPWDPADQHLDVDLTGADDQTGVEADTVQGNGGNVDWFVWISATGDVTIDGAESDVAPLGAHEGEKELRISHICVGDEPGTEPSPSFGQSFEGDTDAPTEPSTDSFGTNGTSGPADGAWLLVVALGVLLASIVVLTPARAKSRR